MKAAVYYENGPPSVFKYEDVPDPECLPQGIVIKVEAVSIEGGDTLNRARGELASKPHIVGYQAAGTIVEVGNEVKHVDLVVDPVGDPTLQKSILSLGYRGRVSTVGDAGREDMRLDISTMRAGNQSLTGVFLGAEIFTDRVHDNIQNLIDGIAKGDLKVVLDKSFPLKDAAAAHEYIESRKAFGRVTLAP